MPKKGHERDLLEKLSDLHCTPAGGLLEHAGMGLLCVAVGQWFLGQAAHSALEAAPWLFHIDRLSATILFVAAAYCAFQAIVLSGFVCWDACTAVLRRSR